MVRNKRLRIYDVTLLTLVLIIILGTFQLRNKTQVIIEQSDQIDIITMEKVELLTLSEVKKVEIKELMQELIQFEHNFARIKLELEEIKIELSKYKENSAKYFTNRYDITEEEFEMLCRMVEAEATGGKSAAKINVAHVIFNRVYSDRFPDTIKGVLFEKNAFSPINDKRFYSVTVSKSTIRSVRAAMTGLDTTKGSTFFMVRRDSDEGNVTWFDSRLRFVMKDNLGHEFFAMK